MTANVWAKTVELRDLLLVIEDLFLKSEATFNAGHELKDQRKISASNQATGRGLAFQSAGFSLAEALGYRTAGALEDALLENNVPAPHAVRVIASAEGRDPRRQS